MPTTEEELAVKELLVLILDNFQNMVKLFTKNKSAEEKKKLKDKVMSTISCDEVYPNIFVGNIAAAKDKTYLKQLGITHVLNTAQGQKWTQVDTDENYYKEESIKYYGLDLIDEPTTDIGKHFREVADFIEDSLNGDGKVLVHCFMGMSRSATCVLAYLMIKKNMTAAEALKEIRQHRFVSPNEGFLLQLVQLENTLKLLRHDKNVTSSL